jgi:hypothetical protein
MLPYNFQYMKHDIIRRQFYGAQTHLTPIGSLPAFPVDGDGIVLELSQ